MLARQHTRLYHFFFFKKKEPYFFLKKINQFNNQPLPHLSSAPPPTIPPLGPLFQWSKTGQGHTLHLRVHPIDTLSPAMGVAWGDGGDVNTYLSSVAMYAWADAAWKAIGNVQGHMGLNKTHRNFYVEPTLMLVKQQVRSYHIFFCVRPHGP